MNKQKLFEELLKKKGIAVPQGPVLLRRSDPGPYKLSFAQRRIWFLQQFDLKGAAYNDPTALRLKGPLQIPVLEQVFNEIIRRHQALRMTFPAREGQPVQALHPDDRIAVSITVPREEPGKTVEEQALDFVNRFSRLAFDLSRDMPIRAALLKITEDDHALAVNIHHIVMDGWSKGIMLQELMTLYEAFSRGKPSPLPELPVQYTDYVHWHHEWMQGKMYETQMAYWKEKLTGAPPVLELPLDHPRPAVPSGRGALQPFSLAKQNFQDLNALAKQEDVTLFMLLTAVYNILLHRYSGQEDILIGTPIAGRRRIELENLIGLFLNTLVLRTDLSGNPGFRTLLKRVRTTALEAYNHQDMPFEKLVEELNPQRDMSITPLFQVLFQLQNAPMPSARLSGLTITPIQLDTGVSQVDLSLTMWEQDDILRGTFEYNTDLLDDATITRMIGHFKRLLESVCEGADREISRLSMLSQEETRQVLDKWNRTGADYPEDVCIYELFETCAQKYPGKDAVVFEQQRLTYKELNDHAGHLAHYLVKAGVGPDVLAAICIDNSLELITGVMGILKAGGAYIPLDPQYPDERLGAILKDSQPVVLITLSVYMKRFPTDCYRGKIICLDPGSDIDALAQESISAISNGCMPENAACVIYTSGSTGIPKGILIENRNIVNLLYSFIRSYHAGPEDNILPLTSIASASFVGEILPMLVSGGAIVLADKEHFLDMNSLTALMSRYEITILSTVPSMIARLNAMGGERWRTGKLRLLLSGGEALSAGDIDRLMDSITIVNGYGLTEATICSTYEVLNSLDFSQNPLITVGKPIMNTRVYILDKYMQPQPVGVPGELYIAGDGLSRGYLNNPELTAEKFIKNRTYRSHKTCNLFKTGDLGAWLPGGRIKFLGRIDTQVQVHGHRIELSEIETVLGLHPDIRDVVVIDRQFGPGDRRLVAYLVACGDGKYTGGPWREWLAKRLPEYMIPTAFEIIDSIPLTVNGKVDISVLPIPSGLRPQLNVAFEAPQTEIEKKIAVVWKEFLHLEEVGVDDNFFDLGGHSLLLTQVHSRLSEMVDKELTIVDLFRYSTIRSLARYLGENKDKIQQASSETYTKLQERANKQRQAFQRRR
ncbi:MAG: amino acid adenylation domain-containing protein [Candidatus Aminicenantes bacterium]|nr:amino acid adenylation domain-containing protein [Candidatus Aminicenantes bacterium]